ncbi:F-box/kelch-repeat protein At3g23880-like [Lotus japonicus]|uniref:F-box/kelch-repeat protein At3g23880-like n=1 Tax=Lotus japonicus TaxID=34305 RepID=UPI00258867C6|nr:F-box/kelch-repeat protein At3g23880-like [Lotus japonicus]
MALPLPSLPFDLIVEILCRLPVKPLLRFRSVSKSWNSLISDPKFAKMHRRCSPPDFTRHHLILGHTNSSNDFLLTDYPLLSVFNAAVPAAATQLDYPLNNPYRFDSIVGSCDGILCLSIDQSRSAVVWNPSTRIFKNLPPLENPQLQGSCTLFGFGYDNLADRYKVVAVFCYKTVTGGYRKYKTDDGEFYKTLVRVHTLGTNSWREIQEFPLCVPFCRQTGRFVSGTVNWSASNESSWFIISLDLGKESYRKLSPPDCGGVVWSLEVLRDCLCILYGDYDVCDVWLMKEYGNEESWTKLFSAPSPRELFAYDWALHITEDDEVLLMFDSKFFLYNFRDNTLTSPQIQNILGWIVPEVYVESLISP